MAWKDLNPDLISYAERQISGWQRYDYLIRYREGDEQARYMRSLYLRDLGVVINEKRKPLLYKEKIGLFP